MPAGTKLPLGFPLAFEGALTSGWDSVGFLYLPEIAESLVPVPKHGNNRRMWILVRIAASSKFWALCAIAGPPGGDRKFWEDLLCEHRTIVTESAIHATLIAGDANIHLPEVVDHAFGCTCLHCKPAAVDKDIHSLLKKSGFSCINPINTATHVSGTTIDLLLTDAPVEFQLTVVAPPGSVASSDHSLVVSSIPAQIQCSYRNGLGRVSWTSSREWEQSLKPIDESLGLLAEMVNNLVSNETLHQQTRLREKWRSRRSIVDSVVWLRDAWYVICGHLAGLVRVSRGKPPSGNLAAKDFEPGETEWTLMRESVSKYLDLKHHDPQSAERWLSSLLKPLEPLNLQLSGADGSALVGAACLPSLQADLQARATSSKPISETAAKKTRDYVAAIRASSATMQPHLGLSSYATFVPFTEEQLDLVLRGVSAGSRALRISKAASRTSSPGARRLLLAIANLTLALQCSPSSCLRREFIFLRKKGPMIVRLTSHLRPISIVAELAALTDGLLLQRIGARLEEHWGPTQCGGTMESLICVIAIVVLCQMRVALGLPTYLVFGDITAAFDGASRAEMMAALFDAKVTGAEWMLIDDIMQHDVGTICMDGVASEVFSLSDGTAQGRKISAHMFNGLMRKLHVLLRSFSAGVAGFSTRWPCRVLDRANTLLSPSAHGYSSLVVNQLIQSCKDQGDDTNRVAEVLAGCPSIDVRLAALDGQGICRLTDVMYIDDVVAPASSPAQVLSIMQAFEEFSKEAGPRFNVGPGKTAALGPLGADSSSLFPFTAYYFDQLLPTTDCYPYLGALIDIGLLFVSHLSMMLSRGQHTFNAFLGNSFCHGLPFPLQASVIPARVEAAALYGLELCIRTVGAEHQLNKLQVSWAKTLLGIQYSREGAWPILLAECGWHRRLGTRMLERAIMLRARILLQPVGNFAHRILREASSLVGSTWVKDVEDIIAGSRLDAFEDILPYLGPATTEQARSSREHRKKYLARYRVHILTPVLQAYDDKAFAVAVSSSPWPYGSFQSSLDALPPSFLQFSWDALTWAYYRTWATVRATGRIPLQGSFAGDLPYTLATCPLCRSPAADVPHFLAFCQGTRDLYNVWAAAAGASPMEDDFSKLLFLLFAGRMGYPRSDEVLTTARVRFVGAVFHRVADATKQQS